jgi:hypothetical protein
MNCDEFKDRLLGAARLPRSEDLEAHASGCAACARLREEAAALAGALKLLRRSAAAEQASAQTEARLLDALAARRRRAAAPPARRLPARRGWPAFAAAAVAALGLAVAVWLAARVPRPVPSARTPAPVAAGRESVARPATPAIAATAEAEAGPATAAGGTRPRAPRRHRPVGALQPRGQVGTSLERSAGSRAPRPDPERIEMTGFFRILPMADGEPRTDLQLVRVRVSSALLEDFGLAVNPRQAGRPVKADVLIGPDGLTRAIRFVGERTW